MLGQRVVWVDYAKALGIFLVILGHAVKDERVVNYIYAFHMPLFFFISGYLFSPDKFSSVQSFLGKRVRQLFIPYLTFDVILYFLWLAKHLQTAGKFEISGEIVRPFIGSLYGTAAIDGFMQYCVPLWFIPCLFAVEVLYYVGKKAILFLLSFCAVIGLFDYTFSFPILPLGFNIALTAVLFYITGNAFKRYTLIDRYKTKPWYFKSVALAGMIAVFVCAVETNGRVDMGSRHYGNYFLFLASGLIGTLLFVLMTVIIAQLFQGRNWSRFIACNTITVMALHLPLLLAIKGIWTAIGGRFGYNFSDNNLLDFAFSVVDLVLICPIIVWLNRNFPVALGKIPERQLKPDAAGDFCSESAEQGAGNIRVSPDVERAERS